ncbi:uncharacterized protein LOC116616257 [Nematostella vectensis]|uniref:uncharacterized protein LOC116616257 n=1 Tax=Nematostella vectensis TaxID=45351 RepID=UPI00138FB7ED|nr:uncharacterized protein LOC116616257 [Nematostella vectensis]XP_032234208.1 uncharacterized protein LOC116616257 [Nematostella vectensis]XP_048581042.1 uncharacterized protein LOC116616257 [Nematostella vectensis]
MMVSGVFLLLACALVSCHADYCADEPDGEYCTDDLKGYHHCYNGKDTPATCPKNTRCVCMGIPCSTHNQGIKPCGTFTLPPSFPDTYKAAGYNEIITGGPHNDYNYHSFYRDAENGKFRHDVTIGPFHDPNYEYFIELPNGDGFDQYEIIPSKMSCVRKSISTLTDPMDLKVPTKYTEHGMATIDGQTCQSWLWKSGGHTSDQPISTENFYTSQSTSATFYPVAYRAEFPGTDGRPTLQVKRDYTFTEGSPDPRVFDIPDYCDMY